MQRGSVFLCDVAHSGAAQSGSRASWDTKIGFVLCSPRSALTHSALLPLVNCVLMVNKHICTLSFAHVCVCVSDASYALQSLTELFHMKKIQGVFPDFFLWIAHTCLRTSTIQTFVCNCHWKPHLVLHLILTQALYGFPSLWHCTAHNSGTSYTSLMLDWLLCWLGDMATGVGGRLSVVTVSPRFA